MLAFVVFCPSRVCRKIYDSKCFGITFGRYICAKVGVSLGVASGGGRASPFLAFYSRYGTGIKNSDHIYIWKFV